MLAAFAATRSEGSTQGSSRTGQLLPSWLRNGGKITIHFNPVEPAV